MRLGLVGIARPLDTPPGSAGDNGRNSEGPPAVGESLPSIPAQGARTLAFNSAIQWMTSTWRGRFLILACVAGISAIAFLLQSRFEVAQLSYGAVAGAVLLASGGLVIPVPALAMTCTTATFLNPAAVAIIAGLSGTIGELTGYFLGYSSSGVLERRRFYHRVEGWMRRRGWLLLFVISAVPNPLFDVAGIAAGALRYPLWRYLVAVGLGKQVKFFMVAYGCYYSVQSLKGVFGL